MLNVDCRTIEHWSNSVFGFWIQELLACNLLFLKILFDFQISRCSYEYPQNPRRRQSSAQENGWMRPALGATGAEEDVGKKDTGWIKCL